MITATFKKRNNQFVSYSVKGHANYAPHGQDVVCAGVSALYTAVTNVLIEQHDAALDSDDAVQLGSIKDSQYIVTVLYMNLIGIAKEYPDNISVEIKNTVEDITSGTLSKIDIDVGNLRASTDPCGKISSGAMSCKSIRIGIPIKSANELLYLKELCRSSIDNMPFIGWRETND